MHHRICLIIIAPSMSLSFHTILFLSSSSSVKEQNKQQQGKESIKLYRQKKEYHNIILLVLWLVDG
jgi:Na+/H+ antiporter NhaC